MTFHPENALNSLREIIFCPKSLGLLEAQREFQRPQPPRTPVSNALRAAAVTSAAAGAFVAAVLALCERCRPDTAVLRKTSSLPTPRTSRIGLWATTGHPRHRARSASLNRRGRTAQAGRSVEAIGPRGRPAPCSPPARTRLPRGLPGNVVSGGQGAAPPGTCLSLQRGAEGEGAARLCCRSGQPRGLTCPRPCAPAPGRSDLPLHGADTGNVTGPTTHREHSPE